MKSPRWAPPQLYKMVQLGQRPYFVGSTVLCTCVNLSGCSSLKASSQVSGLPPHLHWILLPLQSLIHSLYRQTQGANVWRHGQGVRRLFCTTKVQVMQVDKWEAIALQTPCYSLKTSKGPWLAFLHVVLSSRQSQMIGLLVLQSSELWKPPFFILPNCLTIYHYEKQTNAEPISSSTLDK